MKRLGLAFVVCAALLALVPRPAHSQGIGQILRLLRPEVLHQLNGDVTRLVNFLPEVDGPNRAIVARLFAHGGLGFAKLGGDGVFRLGVRVPSGQFMWRPAIVVMGRAGDLELSFRNLDDYSHHQVLLPNNGGRMFLDLPSHASGRVRIRLDAPGLYWFGCPVANHAGRGMLGLVIVKGDVPDDAKLDRPKQPRP